jgi:hypothetical protein
MVYVDFPNLSGLVAYLGPMGLFCTNGVLDFNESKGIDSLIAEVAALLESTARNAK